MSGLVEEVGAAIQGGWDNFPNGLPPIELTDAERAFLARAVIPIILEKAAKVAEYWTPNRPAYRRDGPATANEACPQIATAIRALASDAT